MQQPGQDQAKPKNVCVLAQSGYQPARTFLETWFPEDRHFLNLGAFVAYFLNYEDGQPKGQVWDGQGYLERIAQADVIFIVASDAQQLQIARLLGSNQAHLAAKQKVREIYRWYDNYSASERMKALWGNPWPVGYDEANLELEKVLEPSNYKKCCTYCVILDRELTEKFNLAIGKVQEVVMTPSAVKSAALPPLVSSTPSSSSATASTMSVSPLSLARLQPAATPPGTSVTYAAASTQNVKRSVSLSTCRNLLFAGSGMSIVGGGALAAVLVLPPAMTIALIAGSIAIALALLMAAWFKDNQLEHAHVRGIK